MRNPNMVTIEQSPLTATKEEPVQQWRSSTVSQFSCSVVPDSLRPHGPQHARPPCPSPTQTHVHWVGDAIQPSHPLSSPSPPALNLFQHQGLFKWVSSSHQVAKEIGASASASVLPMNIQDCLSFKPTFSLSSFTFIKRLFSSSSLSIIRVVSSAYLRLLIFFLAIFIPACASFSPAFHMMYSAYKFKK